MTDISIWLSAFVGCAVGSVVPVIHTELLVFGIAALAPGAQGWLLVLVATCGTMVGKTVLYYTGLGILKLPIRKRERIDAYLAKARESKGIAGSVMIAAATFGLPPYYIVTVAAGAIRYNLVRFLIIGFIGRFIRFTAVVFAPHLIKGLIEKAGGG
jgi:membrane protein YqaA with SNARE-associated domain